MTFLCPKDIEAEKPQRLESWKARRLESQGG